nr:retrovirus-related Pol polyprotein from transposon TNT 1-94 [Tanacetum cinerariifolium]
QVKKVEKSPVKADESLAKHKAWELEIERLLRAVVSQDIMSVVQNNSVGDTSNLQTELERTKERFKNCVIKKENEYAKLWNDWYKKCEECKYDKISYDKAYNDMQQKIKRLQAQLRDLKVKSKDTSCVSYTLNPLFQKLENENVELEFQVLNYAKENAHLKTTYKNLFDSISGTRTQTKTIINSLQNKLHDTIYENATLRAQLFDKVFEQKDTTSGTRLGNTAKTRRPQPRSNTMNDRVPSASKSSCSKNKEVEVEEHPRNLLLSKNKKHMSTEFNNVKLATPNVKSKVVCAMCYPNLFMGNILITRVYFVEGLGHNLFSVGQFYDSDLEVAFRRNTCFVRNLEGVDLLKGNRTTNLYAINLLEMAFASPICLMARATSTKSWLWHQRLSHLNFDTINDLAKNDLGTGLLKFKYHKEHLCLLFPNSRQRLHLLHMDLCGPMGIASINGKRYILVIVDDYSRYTWVQFLRSKDEAPEVIKTFLKRITVLLQSPVIIIRTENGTEFKNQVLKEYFDSVGISHQVSSVRTPQQNGVVEQRNRTLVEAARTMLIFSRAPLFLWDEAIATACFTQNRSIIHCRFNKAPYELINGRKPDIAFLHVFSALCYPKNDRKDIRKLGAKGDIGFFIGYSADSCAYRVYNQRTKKIMEIMNVKFDELLVMVFEQSSSKPRLQSMTSGQISSRIDLTYASSTITTQQPTEGELDLLFEAMYDDYICGQPSAAPRTVPTAQAH